MKKLTTLILFIAVAQISYGQIDNTTKNKIKAYYFTAENLYEKGEYAKALDKISEIEAFGVKLATSQNLKVKTLVKLKQYQKAKDELDALYSLNPNKEIYEDIAEYSSVIDEGLEAERLTLKKALEIENQNIEKRQSLIKSATFGSPIDGFFGSLPEDIGLITENDKYSIINIKGKVIMPLMRYKEVTRISPELIVADEFPNYSSAIKSDLYSISSGLVLSGYNRYNALFYYTNGKKTALSNLVKVVRLASDGGGSLIQHCYLYSINDKKFILKNVQHITQKVSNGIVTYYNGAEENYFEDGIPSKLDISSYLD